MSQVPIWFERKFEFTYSLDLLPNLLARLRGTPARLEETLRGRAPEILTAKPQGKWSAQEHAGHLLDLDSLWQARVEDFAADRQTLTVADLTNRKTDEAAHNTRPLSEILAAFRAARRQLLSSIENSPPSAFSRTIPHPRLQQPMRLVDHLYFAAEHDDHHLAIIRKMINT